MGWNMITSTSTMITYNIVPGEKGGRAGEELGPERRERRGGQKSKVQTKTDEVRDVNVMLVNVSIIPSG